MTDPSLTLHAIRPSSVHASTSSTSCPAKQPPILIRSPPSPAKRHGVARPPSTQRRLRWARTPRGCGGSASPRTSESRRCPQDRRLARCSVEYPVPHSVHGRSELVVSGIPGERLHSSESAKFRGRVTHLEHDCGRLRPISPMATPRVFDVRWKAGDDYVAPGRRQHPVTRLLKPHLSHCLDDTNEDVATVSTLIHLNGEVEIVERDEAPTLPSSQAAAVATQRIRRGPTLRAPPRSRSGIVGRACFITISSVQTAARTGAARRRVTLTARPIRRNARLCLSPHEHPLPMGSEQGRGQSGEAPRQFRRGADRVRRSSRADLSDDDHSRQSRGSSSSDTPCTGACCSSSSPKRPDAVRIFSARLATGTQRP